MIYNPEYIKKILDEILQNSDNIRRDTSYIVSRYEGIAAFSSPDEDCPPEEQSIPSVRFLFPSLKAAIERTRSGEKVKNLCRDIYEGKISNIILLNNPLHDYDLNKFMEFKENFKKLINVYSEKYGIEVILIDLEEFYGK